MCDPALAAGGRARGNDMPVSCASSRSSSSSASLAKLLAETSTHPSEDATALTRSQAAEASATQRSIRALVCAAHSRGTRANVPSYARALPDARATWHLITLQHADVDETPIVLIKHHLREIVLRSAVGIIFSSSLSTVHV
jgi:hypothetical protein